MSTFAIVGASGFIGSRMVEKFHLGQMANVRPVVRAASSLARSSRYDLDARVADALDEPALTSAFEGSDVVVHAVAGSARLIMAAVEPVYRAAEKAGVRRLIYISTASVHGQSPPPGTDETSPLPRRQRLPYNNAKVRAERILRGLRSKGDVEVVILRPGIVFGPRSFWVGSFADALLSGTAYLVEGGYGICNAIYVDNLIHAVHLAATAPGVDGEAFLVGDREKITWRELYAPVARALGKELEQVPSVPAVTPTVWSDRLDAFRRSRRAKTIVSLLPAKLRRGMVRKRTPSTGGAGRPTLEMSLLHTCGYKLPHGKAERLLGYDPTVPFAEGCRRTVAWMSFAGYTVAESGNCHPA